MRLIRYIHPIGQGAFFTEQFFDNNNKRIATVVYDCGSCTNKADIEREIRGTFEQGEEVDYLFISHFHNDHINGIEELKKRTNIKKVVIPLYDRYDRLLYIATISSQDEKTYKKLAKLIINPKEYFNEETDNKRKNGKMQDYETEIIWVKPMDNTSEESDFDDQDRIQSSGESIEKVFSNTTTKSFRTVWEYVPFNNSHKEKSRAFYQECQKQKIPTNNLDQIIHDKYYRNLLKKTYKKVFGNKSLNESSMLVYSGLKENDPNRNASIMPNGSLYTGDATLDDVVIKQLDERFQLQFNNLSLFQIPHHASQQSFDLRIIDLLKQTPSSLVMFASCGNMNTYGHPSPYVITQSNLFLRDHTKSPTAHEQNFDFITEQRVRIVTESKNTMLVLQYEFNNNTKTIPQ